jgi:hypothetical protein
VVVTSLLLRYIVEQFQRSLMKEVGSRDAKRPHLSFEADGQSERQEVFDAARQAAARRRRLEL